MSDHQTRRKQRNALKHARRAAHALPECLRVGMFSESFHPVQNGVTTAVLTLVGGLRRQGHRVCIFAPDHQEGAHRMTNVMRVPSFVSAFNPQYPLAYPFLPRLALTSHFDGLKLDLVHTHTPFVMGLTGQKLALLSGLPVVSTFHTLYSQYSHYVPILPDTVTQRLLEHYLPWYYNRCQQVICPSEVARRVLQENGVETPISIIRTGIPLPAPRAVSADVRAATRQKLGYDEATPLLLYAGRLATEKNVGWLLEATACVAAFVPDVRLVLAGSGPLREELAAQAIALGIGRNVQFLGATPRRDMDALYAAADVFCFPSPSETQGLVIGEARAAGLPCVVVDAGGAPETVTEGLDGFRVPEGDTAAFAARIQNVLADVSLRQTLRAGCLRQALLFTPAQMIAQTLNVYEQALDDTTPWPDARRFYEDDAEWTPVAEAAFEPPIALRS